MTRLSGISDHLFASLTSRQARGLVSLGHGGELGSVCIVANQ